MPDQFDAPEFVRYVRSQWRVFALSCGIAVTLALSGSLLLPKQFTATATLLIEPPGGNDPRAATVLSPIYLESLRTYERIASNNTLFVRGLNHLHLRDAYPGVKMESLKQRILKVSKPTNTKVLEINATLPDPRQAQAFAQFMAEQTVGLSKSLDAGSENEATREARAILAESKRRLDSAEAGRESFLKAEPVQELEDVVANTIRLQALVQSDLAKAQAELAYYAAQLQTAGGNATGDPGWVRTQVTALQARIKSLEMQAGSLTQQLAAQTPTLEKRRGRREVVEAELKSARAQYDSANAKLNDILSSSVFRGERLHVIDPGIVPERPSFPNLPLNVIIAFFVSLAGSAAYVAVRFSWRVKHVRADATYSFR